MVACLKRLLPVGLNLFAGREQELVQHCKEKFLAVSFRSFLGSFLLWILKDYRFVVHNEIRVNVRRDSQPAPPMQKVPESEILVFAKTQLTLPDKIDPSDAMNWQHTLYSRLGGGRVPREDDEEKKLVPSVDETVDNIVAMAKVLYGLHIVSIADPKRSPRGTCCVRLAGLFQKCPARQCSSSWFSSYIFLFTLQGHIAFGTLAPLWECIQRHILFTSTLALSHTGIVDMNRILFAWFKVTFFFSHT